MLLHKIRICESIAIIHPFCLRKIFLFDLLILKSPLITPVAPHIIDLFSNPAYIVVQHRGASFEFLANGQARSIELDRCP